MSVSDAEAEALLWEQSTLRAEVDDLRAALRKVKNSVGWWAALSYVDHCHGAPSRWSAEEQELLHRSGL